MKRKTDKKKKKILQNYTQLTLRYVLFYRENRPSQAKKVDSFLFFFLKDRKNVWIVKNYGREKKKGIGEANHRVLGKLKGLYKEKSHYRAGNC